jgi:hypothetical protein
MDRNAEGRRTGRGSSFTGEQVMNRQCGTLRKACLGLLALAVLGVFPAAASADGLGFRNDLKIPIIVQGESVVDNVLRRGQPLLIYPGKVAWDTNLKQGDRWISIYDARLPNRVLLRRYPIRFLGGDIPHAVVPLPVPATAFPRVKLMTLPTP